MTALVPIIIADKESVSNDSTREETKWNIVLADMLNRGHKSHLSDVWSYLCSAQDHRSFHTQNTEQKIDSEEHQDIVEDIN